MSLPALILTAALAVACGSRAPILGRPADPQDDGIAALIHRLQHTGSTARPDPAPTSSDAAGLEDRIQRQLPYVTPSRLLTCARLADREGRAEDALHWIETALRLSPAQSAEFLVCLQELQLERQRGRSTSGRAQRRIGELVHGRDWLVQSDPTDREEWCRSLLVRARRHGLTGRLGVAAWCEGRPDRCPPGGSLLDQACSLYRQALDLGADQGAAALELLDQAAALAPPAVLATPIHGARFRLLVQERAPLELIQAALLRGLEDPDRLLPHLDRGLRDLASQGDRTRLAECLQILQAHLEDHPYAARLRLLGASLASSPLRRRALLEQALAAPRGLPPELPSPQAEAARELARMSADAGRWRDAASFRARGMLEADPRDPRELAAVLDHLLRAGCHAEAARLHAAARAAFADLSAAARASVQAVLDAPFLAGAHPVPQ